MPKYESSRRPEITAHDLAHVTMLLGCFDKITFNGYGEVVALLKVKLPVVGDVTISLYDREDHIQVYLNDDSDPDKAVWSGRYPDIDHDFEGKYDRDRLLNNVKMAIRERIALELV